jgi:uncharacterized protein YrrD/ElaB/YqjD/DUF883 family membrane-anchored ribosome-binding protein
MTTQPEVVRQNDLLNQLVLDRDTLEELGRVEVLWMYPPAHRVLGFVGKTGFLGSKKFAFQLAQIHAIGVNGVLTHSPPEETNAEKVRQLESLIQHEVWSDEGNKIGKISDCLFNLRTGEITHYLFISNGWAGITGEVYQLPPTQILSFGKKRVLVSEGLISSFSIYQEGIPQKLTKARDFLKEEATQEWRSLTERAEATTEQAKGRLQNLTGRARERAQQLSQQAREKARSLNERLKEETQTLVEQAKEKSHVLAEQVKEGTQTLGKQVEEGIQTLTVHAEEIIDSVTEEASKDAPPTSPTPTVNSAPVANSEDAKGAKAIDEEDWGDEEDSDLEDEPWDDELWDTTEELPATPATSLNNPNATVSPARTPLKELEEDDDEPWI